MISDPALLTIRMQINNSHITVAIPGFRLVIDTAILIVGNVVDVMIFELCKRA